MNRSDRTPRALLTIAVLLLFAGVSLPLVGIGEGLTFSTDSDIVLDTRDQENYDIVSVGSGDTAHVYVVYEDHSVGTDPHVFFHRSIDGGVNWQSPIDFMPADPNALDKQLTPAIDVYNDGMDATIAVVYMDSTYRELPNLVEWVLVVRTSTDGGVSWSVDRLVTPTSSINYPSDEIKDPRIAFDPYGNLFVSWTSLSGDDRINMAYSTDLGATWSGIHVLPNHAVPQDPEYDHRKSSIASDGQYVVVTWYDANQYREIAYMSRASAASLSGYPTLSFSSPQRISTTLPYDYQSWYPKVVADTNAIHIVWWDFHTDPGGANNYPNIDTDRPSVKYVRSLDHGATWVINGKENMIINTSNPTGWHSAPDIDIGYDGTLAVTWMDYTLGKPNIFVTVSKDMGSTWSKPARANDHYPDIYREEPAVGVDDNGDPHVMWTYHEDINSDWDLKHARSIVNQPPQTIDDLTVLVVDERYGMVGWTPIREPDFNMYYTFVSEEENFSIPVDLSEGNKWPVSPYYNDSKKQLMNLEVFNRNIQPDTTYYAKVVVEDQEGLTSVSNEVTFKTRPVNKPPEFTRDIPTLYMDEDIPVEGILNLTKWREMGWIWDDVYNGYPLLDYFVESEAEEPNITASIRKVGLDPEYHLLDFYPASDVNDWYGKEKFRIGVRDSGKDGGIGTPDDRIGYSNWFTLQVNSTNDVPIWMSFYDLNSDVNKPLKSSAREVRLTKLESGALEDMEYRFSMTANDVDGDFLEYEASDNRVKVTVDGQDPQHKSIFTFTPDNDDVPEINMTIFVTDNNGGERNITVFIPVENINGAPEFRMVNDISVPKTGGSVDFQINEKGENSSITFQVIGWDEDFGDILTLKSISEKPTIEKIAPFLWNVTVTATEEDGVTGFISFGLELWDRQRSDLSTLLVNITVLNVQDKPDFYGEKVRVLLDYDENDDNEWTNSRIDAEWDEPVEFKAFARDRDGDELTYTWSFKNENSGEEFTADGNEVTVKFYPSSFPTYEDLILVTKVSDLKSEKFLINLTVSDGRQASADIYYYRELWLWPDDDNDNDGMPDKREIFFFGDLSEEPDGNFDFDDYTNIEEIGFGIPQFQSETRSPYSIDRNQMDPSDPEVYPGSVTVGDDDDETEGENEVPVFLIVIITIVVLAVLGIVSGIVVIMRIQKKKEEEEEEDIEKRVKQMEERQKTLEGLYGVQKAGDIVGPDQSTLDDLTLDLGGQVYHEEGSKSLVSGADKAEMQKKKEESTGPQWESTGGPVFEDTAPELEFGHSLELQSVDDVMSGDVDDSQIENTMDDLMDAADEFDEDAMKNAGGNVLIGAVPMEEQIKQMQGQQGIGGPRNPPPGQAPPQQQMPPQQMPPQVAQAPQQQGLPPAKPVQKPKEE